MTSDIHGGKWAEHGTKSARLQRPEVVRGGVFGPERDTELVFAQGIRAYRIKILTHLSQYNVPKGYNLDTLVTGNDTVNKGFEKGRDPLDIAEDIAREKGWR